jgi:GTP-binding protein
LSKIISAGFVTSSPGLADCPPPSLPEYAFLGRSNVGKSSLINMLTGMRMLAKTSTSPGKTRLINHFLINEKWYIVDLPGYGYAKVGQETRKKWEKLTENYLLKRDSLMTTFLLVDARLPLQENDRAMINWFGQNNLPFVIIMTKTDKLSKVQVRQNEEAFATRLLEDWEELPLIVLSSAKTGLGKAEILDYIDETNGLFSV